MIASRIFGIPTVLETERVIGREEDPSPWLAAARAFHEQGFMSEEALVCFADGVLDVVVGWRTAADPEASGLWQRINDLVAEGARFDEMDETEPRAEIDVVLDRWVATVTSLRATVLRRSGCVALARLYETDSERWRTQAEAGRLEWMHTRPWNGAPPWPSNMDDDDDDDAPESASPPGVSTFDAPRPWTPDAESDVEIREHQEHDEDEKHSPRSVLEWALEERTWSPPTALNEFDWLVPEESAETTLWVRAAEALWRECRMTEDMLLFLVDRLLQHGVTDREDADAELERLFAAMRLLEGQHRTGADRGWDSPEARREYELVLECWRLRGRDIAIRYLASIGCQWLLPAMVGDPGDLDERLSNGDREWLDEDNAI